MIEGVITSTIGTILFVLSMYGYHQKTKTSEAINKQEININMGERKRFLDQITVIALSKLMALSGVLIIVGYLIAKY